MERYGEEPPVGGHEFTLAWRGLQISIRNGKMSREQAVRMLEDWSREATTQEASASPIDVVALGDETATGESTAGLRELRPRRHLPDTQTAIDY